MEGVAIRESTGFVVEHGGWAGGAFAVADFGALLPGGGGQRVHADREFTAQGGGEFAWWRGLALFQESVGAEDDATGIPKADEPEAAVGFELEECLTCELIPQGGSLGFSGISTGKVRLEILTSWFERIHDFDTRVILSVAHVFREDFAAI